MNSAGVGVGSSYHLLIEQMMVYGKLSMTHVPYRGGAAAMTDFLAGRVDATGVAPIKPDTRLGWITGLL